MAWIPAEHNATELQNIFDSKMYSERYLFTTPENGIYTYSSCKNMEKYELIWTDNDGNFTGFAEFYRSNALHTFYIDNAVSLIEGPNIEFLNAIKEFVKKNFIKNSDMWKLQWGACPDNPANTKYNKIFERLTKTKRYIGEKNVHYMSMRTFDGKLRDQVTYQIIKTDKMYTYRMEHAAERFYKEK